MARYLCSLGGPDRLRSVANGESNGKVHRAALLTPKSPDQLAKVPHICELQLKFLPIYLAVETGGSHEHYEYFRTYFSGGDRAAVQKRMALLDKLGSADSVETFVRDAMKGDDSVAWLTQLWIPRKSDVYFV